MNYTLAKKLKDAGFPQDREEEYLSDGWFINEEDKYHTHQENGVIIPTLSELIEACGLDGVSMFFLEGPTPADYWYAKFQTEFGGPMIEERGKTPEEAVANLWLELNKDNDK